MSFGNAHRQRLRDLYEAIDGRTSIIAASHPDWPCRCGCAQCCRTLGEPPRATRLEWEALWAAYKQLDPCARRSVRARAEDIVRGMGRRPRPRYWVCPFLDETTGVCLVYDERLAVCRMHGYYAGRDGGRWCDRIEALATNPIGLVTLWGNYEAVCRELEALGGEPISLAQWLEECPTRSP